MALPLLNDDGLLPLGRWPATVEEIASQFVEGQSARRQQIWADWLDLTDALSEVLRPLPAAWLGGSFFTDKEEPGDIDSVYIVEWAVAKVAKVHPNPQHAQLVQTVADNQVKDLFGLSVDSFILEWWPSPGTKALTSSRGYRERRGYWDDLWSRRRSLDTRIDAVPSRGYVEVIIDGYS